MSRTYHQASENKRRKTKRLAPYQRAKLRLNLHAQLS